MALPQIAGFAAVLAAGLKELIGLLSDGAKAVSQLADHAAELKQLSRETDLSLASLQKLDYAAQLKGLEFDKIQEDLPKLVEEFSKGPKAEGKSFEQFLIELSKSDTTLLDKNWGLNKETIRLLRNDDGLTLQEVLDQVTSKNLVLSDEHINNLAELSKAINSLKATQNSVGNEFISKRSQAMLSFVEGSENMLRDNREIITDLFLLPDAPADKRIGKPFSINYPSSLSEDLEKKSKYLGKIIDDVGTAFSRAGDSMLQLHNRLSDELGLHPTSQTDAWNNAPKGFGRGGIAGGGGSVIDLPTTPGAGLNSTRRGAGNAAGTAGAVGTGAGAAGAEAGAAGAMGLSVGAGNAAGVGGLRARLGTLLSSVDWNYFREMKEMMLLVQHYEAVASRQLNPYKTILPRQGSLPAPGWGWGPVQGQSTVVNDHRTTNITVSTPDPVRAGEVAAQSANPPYSTPGAYTPVAC